jgi:nucleoside-diphosphate-sugar epimerase
MTVIGSGDIASAIVDRPGLTFFAAGVSNSAETRESEYTREFTRLFAQPPTAHLVYFSSLCVFYSSGRYATHKRMMEDFVRNSFPRHTIIRLGTITWGRNPHLLINHLRLRRERGEPLEIQDVTRYVCDLAEFQHWLGLIPPFPAEMNITGRRMTVAEIVEEFVCDRTSVDHPAIA